MLSFLETYGEFRTNMHMTAFTANGWSLAQVEVALNGLASIGLVELRIGLDGAPFIVASLRHRERPYAR
jgi:hypothetical protein